MKFVQPKVRLIAKSMPSEAEIKQMLLEVGCSEDVASAYAFAHYNNPAERIIELAGRRCYKSFQVGLNPNVNKIRGDIADYIANILESGHGSVLEHAHFTFSIENVSRVFTGEMNRHRAGVAISEASMRYIRYTDIPFVEVPFLRMTGADWNDPDVVAYTKTPFGEDISCFKSFAYKKLRTREAFSRIIQQIEHTYTNLTEIWAEELRPDSKFSMKKHLTSLLRRIIPMGVATGGIWTANVRALRHICTMRCSEAAEEEICLIAGQILDIMRREEPLLFGDFHLNEKGFWEPEYVKV